MVIYWLLFIYFSLQMMDEMIELFSVINQLEKGALGLFFEMNYFVGVVLACYIAWFNWHFEKPIAVVESNQVKFDHMYNWLWFQYIYLYGCLFLSMMVYCMYRNMDDKASKKIKESKDKQVEREKSLKKIESEA